ncbi:alpha/beta hydrolase fold domain-containing protein [Nocardia brasiliensis]
MRSGSTQGPAGPIFIGPARLGTRLAHRVLRWTVRPLLGLGAFFIHLGDRPARAMFRLANCLDPVVGLLPSPRHIRRKPVDFSRFRAEWLWQDDISDPVRQPNGAILYFHGGGFIACGLNTHRRFVAEIGRRTGVPVLNVDYRQLPAAQLTETLEDAIESYTHVLEAGFAPERIIVSGDSAGGGLALLLVLAARERGLPLPGGMSLLSPWADLHCGIRRTLPNARYEAVLPPLGVHSVPLRGYAVAGVLDPTLSIADADFTGMPPMLVQVGSRELFRHDADLLWQACSAAKVPMRLEIWDEAPHVFHGGFRLLADACAAIDHTADFHHSILLRHGRPRGATA